MWPFAVDAAVRVKLDRIMASDYYTAAAVGGGSYGAEGVQAQESITISPEGRGTFSRGELGC